MLRGWVAKRPMAVSTMQPIGPACWPCSDGFADIRGPRFTFARSIPGIDTKFVETRKNLLSELLDLALPPDAIDPQAAGARGFEQRYGLLQKPPLVRFRLLDRRLAIDGLTDLSVPAEQFARLSPSVSRVFITENEVNGLAFPEVPAGLVIFGLGYSLESLADARWLADKLLYYWGDIDTHGFAMLDRFRSRFPETHSFLMDRDTLLAHHVFWVTEASPHRGHLRRLEPGERSLFEDLCGDRLGNRIRLEQ